jgi:hypothetical protein
VGLRQGREVRCPLLFFCLTISASSLQAQDQETKLIDRIMRPNMELANPAQNKKFLAVEGTSVDKKFEAKQFRASEKVTPAKSFWGARSFLSKAFGTGKFARAEAAANAKANADLAYASTQFQDKKSSLVRTSAEGHETIRAHRYANSRPFLAKGTRQKQLSTQNRPMTIEEVRELLNTNR